MLPLTVSIYYYPLEVLIHYCTLGDSAVLYYYNTHTGSTNTIASYVQYVTRYNLSLSIFAKEYVVK